jgi:hypothetical protein
MIAIDDSANARLTGRILGEFREMPGLSLTIEQACRLWGCDAATCRGAIETLVAGGHLRWTRNGCMIRARSADDVGWDEYLA